MKPIDLRSDTVTQPTAAMREGDGACAVWATTSSATIPTVNKLQEVAAERFGMQAGLFFPVGHAVEPRAVMAHCARGEEVDRRAGRAHLSATRRAAPAVLGSIQPQPLTKLPGWFARPRAGRGRPSSPTIRISPSRSSSRLENTIGGKGAVAPVHGGRDRARAPPQSFPVHLDGARIFNAAVKLGMPVKQLCEGFDTVSVCLSKGLGTPAGTVLVGKKDVIDRARRIRKMLGGTMRQVGIPRRGRPLRARAQRRSPRRGTTRTPSGWPRASPRWAQVDPVQTNMVFVHVPKDRPRR
jgi:threonine aldolase